MVCFGSWWVTPTNTTGATQSSVVDHSQQQVTKTKQNTASSNNSNVAYASVLGGVDPAHPSYRGFLYSILVAAKILKDAGSTSDIVVFFQLSHATDHTVLPQEDVRLLRAMEVIIVYIPKSQHQGFYEITLEKFRILDLIQYDRVLFMDADVMPLGNLDYLMELSLSANNPGSPMQENLVVAGSQEPSTAGFFLLTPGHGKLDRLRQVISKRELKAKYLPFPKFDIVAGWGHVIKPPDRWETRVAARSGTNWTFYSADADQGLLYEWAKYVEQRVSIVIGNRVQNWAPGVGGYPALQETLEKPFQKYSSRLNSWARGPPPYRHFYHFTGRSKPWESTMPESLSEANHKKTPERFWFYHLLELNKQLAMFDPNDWETVRAKMSAPPLGRFHAKLDMASRVDRNNAAAN